MPAWSGLYDSVHPGGYSLYNNIPNPARRLRKAVRGMGAIKLKKTLRTFVTDDVGTTISGSHSRVIAGTPFDAPSNGGKRTVETVTDINRAATAEDETALLKEIDNSHTPTFPTEKSGNSGGGKLGF